MKKKIKDRNHTQGYLQIYIPNHPLAFKDGYVLSHRLVMEKELLKHSNYKDLHVHHIDKNKHNNKKENLMVVDRDTHAKLNSGWELINNEWYKKCRCCLRFLKIDDENFYKRRSNNTYFYLCKKCANKDSAERIKYYRSLKKILPL